MSQQQYHTPSLSLTVLVHCLPLHSHSCSLSRTVTLPHVHSPPLLTLPCAHCLLLHSPSLVHTPPPLTPLTLPCAHSTPPLTPTHPPLRTVYRPPLSPTHPHSPLLYLRTVSPSTHSHSPSLSLTVLILRLCQLFQKKYQLFYSRFLHYFPYYSSVFDLLCSHSSCCNTISKQ